MYYKIDKISSTYGKAAVKPASNNAANENKTATCRRILKAFERWVDFKCPQILYDRRTTYNTSIQYNHLHEHIVGTD